MCDPVMHVRQGQGLKPTRNRTLFHTQHQRNLFKFGRSIYLDPLPTTQRTNRYIFFAVDMFSKLVFNMPIANCDAMTVAQALFEIVCQYGVCDTIISDRGGEFISSCTGELCKLLGFIHHCLGACERTHRTLHMKCCMDFDRNSHCLCCLIRPISTHYQLIYTHL